MAQVKDPVCSMTVDSESAAYSTLMGSMYYFCSRECRDVFEANPSRYVSRSEAADSRTDEERELEKHEPPFTKKGPVVAPKFGSAGSGGLEFEPGPERHKKP
jgi:YHS domain-containing protein